jgi:hypothetical protein
VPIDVVALVAIDRHSESPNWPEGASTPALPPPQPATTSANAKVASHNARIPRPYPAARDVTAFGLVRPTDAGHRFQLDRLRFAKTVATDITKPMSVVRVSHVRIVPGASHNQAVCGCSAVDA